VVFVGVITCRLAISHGLFGEDLYLYVFYYYHILSYSLGFFYQCIYGCIGFGGLEVACWPLVPNFAGSNPAQAVGFLRAKNSSARLPSEGK